MVIANKESPLENSGCVWQVAHLAIGQVFHSRVLDHIRSDNGTGIDAFLFQKVCQFFFGEGSCFLESDGVRKGGILTMRQFLMKNQMLTEAVEFSVPELEVFTAPLNETIEFLDLMDAKGALDFSKGGLAMLEEFVHQVEPTLVIIDPLVAYIGAVDIYRANETRAVMARLADMAERHSAAILAIRHLTKSGALKPIYRGIGSIDLTAACRSVLLAGCDPDNPQERGLVQIKSNLAPTGVAIGYELKEGDFFWTGESDLTWQRMVSAEDTDEGKSAVDDAMGFLKEKLAEGPVDAPVVLRDARNAGLSERTVRRAKAKLGVVAKRQGDPGKRGGGKWKWELVD